VPFSIVIPSRNAQNLHACVKAIKYEDFANIFVIDDGLPVGAALYASPAKIVKGDQPFCFSRNVNIGITKAHPHDVIILNDDAVLKTPDGFSKLAQSAKRNPEYGLIAAATNNVGNVNQQPQGKALREEPRMVCFICVFVPRSTIEKIGMLDERFWPGTFEDDDYCLRVRRAGLKIGILDSCFVDHNSLSSTMRKNPTMAAVAFQTNRDRFIAKYGSHPL
jgi:GT2 family glycosyltransferase